MRLFQPWLVWVKDKQSKGQVICLIIIKSSSTEAINLADLTLQLKICTKNKYENNKYTNIILLTITDISVFI